jgi:general secretion pathway protein G
MRLLLLALFADFTRNREPAERRPRDERGFTLTELMVVLFIVGLLSAVVLINVLPSQDRAMVTKARADIATLENAMEQYRLDNLTYPNAADGLAALRSAPAGLADPSRYRPGGYVRNLPEDPWGRPYQLAVPGRNGAPFSVYSLGADGAPGGENENADIYGSEG